MSFTETMEVKLDYPKPKESLTINYFKEQTIINLNAPSKDIISHVVKATTPFMSVAHQDSDLAKFKVLVYNFDLEKSCYEKLLEEGADIAIDKSLYEDLSSKGKKIDLKNGYLILVQKTNTIFYFNTQDSEIKLFNSSIDDLTLDTLRIVKSLITLECEGNGNLVLHASGVVLEDNDTLLFLGDSRNGKTTILLEILTRFQTDMLSCDTSILKIENDQLIARGWPSNFSISFGTLHDYPELYEFVPSEQAQLTYNKAWEIFDKYVLNTKEVIQKLPSKVIPEANVIGLVYLNFDTAAKTQIFRVDDEARIAKHLEQVYLGSKDPIYPNWHEYLTTSEDQIQANIQRIIEFR